MPVKQRNRALSIARARYIAKQFINNGIEKSQMKLNDYAKGKIDEYYNRLSNESDQDVRSIVERERMCCGWNNERSYYLVALRQVCRDRKLQYCW